MKARNGPFSPMNPGESEVFAFDFTLDLAPGDTVAASPAPLWSVTVASGPGTGNPADGVPTLTGNKTFQRITNPVAGTVYILAATVKTGLGNTLTLWDFLPCRAPGVFVPPPAS